jgi:endonuclease VIII
MPEGDSIFRAAVRLERALAGRTVTRFESVFSKLNRVDRTHQLRGRTIERVTPRGKHLLMWFTGDLVLHTHMRMHGSWHLYRPGERWGRPAHDMRIVVATDAWEAVAFNVPVADFVGSAAAEQTALRLDLGPDLLAVDFDAGEALRRLEALPDMEIADALLDQHVMAGIGNIYKSETLYACRLSPFAHVGALSRERLERVVSVARSLLHAHASGGGRTGRWSVYGRNGAVCRRCGTRIMRRAQGANARATFWCPICQREDEPARWSSTLARN